MKVGEERGTEGERGERNKEEGESTTRREGRGQTTCSLTMNAQVQ